MNIKQLLNDHASYVWGSVTTATNPQIPQKAGNETNNIYKCENFIHQSV